MSQRRRVAKLVGPLVPVTNLDDIPLTANYEIVEEWVPEPPTEQWSETRTSSV